MDKQGGIVRKREHAEPVCSEDARVQRTRQALVLALVQLVLVKRYDAITIRDLLERSGVARSTFYSHYRGKDDLLLKSFERMLEGLDRCLDDEPQGGRIAPVRELFRHVGEFRRFQQALARARVLDRQYQVGIVRMSRTIERRLAARGRPSGDVPPGVQATAHAGALFALLRWWIEHDSPHTPEQMDKAFHALRFAGR